MVYRTFRTGINGRHPIVQTNVNFRSGRMYRTGVSIVQVEEI